MSLKAFHIVFITISILLTFGFAAWAVVDYLEYRRFVDVIFAVGAVASGAGLIRYSIYVLRKLKHISYL